MAKFKIPAILAFVCIVAGVMEAFGQVSVRRGMGWDRAI